MTDKQIIDEVDVSKCKYHNNGWCLLSESCDAIRYRPCGDMTLFDCYYRNWQRKEQEGEGFKETCDGLLKVQYELADSNKKLRQALTEIKEIIHFNKTNRLSGGACISIEQILQICDEVNDAN